MARDNVVIIIAKGTGWGSDRVSLGAFKAHTHTHFQCGKRMHLKEGQLFGWLVRMARWPTVNSTCAYGRASGCGGKPGPAAWDPVILSD